ncbi:Golgi reassembly-stacking protein 1 [Paramecium bursaria]
MGQSQGGYRIIGIDPDSLASNLDLQLFLDYIISDQIQLLESDEPVELKIFNIFSQTFRNIYISYPRSQYKLGLQIRYESINQPIILRIMNVLPDSPASKAGLVSNVEYLLGLLSHKYESLSEFGDIITGIAYQRQIAKICVFIPGSLPKMVDIRPQIGWGGPGALGCEFAQGAIHNFTTQLGQRTILKQNLEQQVDENQNFQINNERNDNQIYQEDDLLVQESIQDASSISQVIEENKQEQLVEDNKQETIQVQFNGIPRFQDEAPPQDQESLIKEQTQESINESFQMKIGSSDYSHMQPKEQEPLTPAQQPQRFMNWSESGFKSPKSDKMYFVDKFLLFDLQINLS